MPRLNGTPWVWVYCANYLCSHARAVALTPWAIRWGVDDPTDLIRQNFRCVMCGQRGAVLNMPSVEHESKSFRAFPIERSVSVGGVRLNQESCNAQSERCYARAINYALRRLAAISLSSPIQRFMFLGLCKSQFASVTPNLTVGFGEDAPPSICSRLFCISSAICSKVLVHASSMRGTPCKPRAKDIRPAVLKRLTLNEGHQFGEIAEGVRGILPALLVAFLKVIAPRFSPGVGSWRANLGARRFLPLGGPFLPIRASRARWE
jgi:hypothetical protein